jgi:hypothetical protein
VPTFRVAGADATAYINGRQKCYKLRDSIVLGQLMETPRLTLRADLGRGRALGPRKIRLLESIANTGSISQAGRDLGMSYRAWLLVDGHEQLLP